MDVTQEIVYLFIKKLRKNIKYLINTLRPLIIDLSYINNIYQIRNKINLFFFFGRSLREKYQKEINFINNDATFSNPLSIIFPYAFVFEIGLPDIDVKIDPSKNLPFILHNTHRLYFKRSFTNVNEIKKYYFSIIVEQHPLSPHRYLTSDFNVAIDDNVLDIGSAEGNFSLDVVERVRKLYIIEEDIAWIEALEATFEPWAQKVEIINRSISNVDTSNSIKLDTLLENNNITFMKIDAEGAERNILQGARMILSNNQKLKIVVTTYHNKNDYKILSRLLKKFQFTSSHSKGFMLFIYDKLKPPYFRIGLIRATKM
jgi:hypothetical protein